MNYFFICGCIFGITNGQIDWTNYGATDIYSDYLNQTTRIFDEIFLNRHYNPNRSPIYTMMPANWTESKQPRFPVIILLAYSKVIEVDAQSQLFGVSVEIYMWWTDIRLAWHPEDYGDVQYFWVNPQQIWLPQNNIANAKTLNEIYPESIQQARLWFNGTVSLIRNYYAETTCPIDVAEFPFDRQLCHLPIHTVVQDRNQVEMVPAINSDFSPNASSNGEWECKGITTNIETWGGALFTFDVLTFTFELHRVPNFYIYVIAIPCFILTGLSIIGMFWTANEKEEQLVKLSIGLTSLVSMTVLLDMVSSSIPKTVKFPLLGIYVVISIVIIAVACVIVVAFRPNHKKLRKDHKEMMVNESLCGRLFSRFIVPHIVFHCIFQLLNISNFVVLMSFWRN